MSRYWEARKLQEIPDGEQNPKEREIKLQIKAETKPQTKHPNRQINKKIPGFLILSSEVGQENLP